EFEGLTDRIVPLDLPERDYTALAVAGPGELYFTFRKWPETPSAMAQPSQPLHVFDLGSARRDTELVANVGGFQPSAAADLLLYIVGQSVYTISTTDKEAEGKRIAFEGVTLEVDVEAEWRQMYDEVWRLMREYFYDHTHHGEDLTELSTHYAKYLPTVTRRADLNRLFEFMLGNVAISHLIVSGGDAALDPAPGDRIGVLGAEFSVHDNRYRIDRIYRRAAANGSNSLALAAPLDQPGIDVREGDFIWSIDGQAVDASKNLYAYLAGTANRAIEIEVASDAQGSDRRTLTVVPLPGDNGVKRMDWFARNAQVVRDKTGGRVLYVPIAGFGADIEGVFAAFAAASDYDGVIVDQRYNGGGITSDSLIQMLTRDRYHHYAFPYGEPLTVPTTLVLGPKVLITNEANGSAAETFPVMWQLAGVGPIVGKRTAGAGTGTALQYPRLVDGGDVRIPNRAGYNPQTGQWLENAGVAPDIEVELDPGAWRQGRDTQLETAIETVLTEIANTPKEHLQTPKPISHP
ncbi:MAG: PDZ domain-containing protein, partial [Candidatus Hydrogenedentales bacterium]